MNMAINLSAKQLFELRKSRLENSSNNGRRYVLVVNLLAGAANPLAILDCLRTNRDKVDIAYQYFISSPSTMDNVLRQAFLVAKLRHQVVLVVGGDGTINLAAQHALRSNTPMAIIPRGTFNLLSRHYHIPTDLDTAIQQIPKNRLEEIPVSKINDIPFMISANFGVYSAIIKNREEHQNKAGFRSRFVACLSGLWTFLTFSDRVSLSLTTDGKSKDVQAQLMMITRNKYHLELLGIQEIDESILEDKLIVVIAHPKNFRDKLKLLTNVLLSRHNSRDFFTYEVVSNVKITSKRKQFKVAIDGELHKISTPIDINATSDRLKLMKPES